MHKPKIAAVTTAVALALSLGQTAQAVEIKGDSWNGKLGHHCFSWLELEDGR